MCAMRPLRPCSKIGCRNLVVSGFCEEHQKQEKAAGRLYDRQRGSSAARGYGWKWQQYRLRFLAMYPLCEECLKEDIYEPATDVDHIVAVSGPNDPLFWASENHQALCHSCHSRKTAKEDGSFIGKIDFYPTNLKPSAVPLTIIHGPPASGKSTYIAQHKQPGDIVIDLGVIKTQLSGKVEYDTEKKWLRPAVDKRNQMLRALSTETRPVSAWFIVGAPTAKEREYWKEVLRPVHVVILDAPEDICIQRILSDPLRKHRATSEEQQIRAVRNWWKAYQLGR
jgi:5-methylcytosine-specific restriction endonuclease McrA